MKIKSEKKRESLMDVMPKVLAHVPASVPEDKVELYKKNYDFVTKKSGRLFLFAGDQKIEHLNKDFFGENIPKECNNPEHLFKIATHKAVGLFATQLGLISRYGKDYQEISYLVKLNSKTNFVSTKEAEPISLAFHTVDDVVQFKESSNLSVLAVGYTIYLGSKHEAAMLKEAAQIITQAHKEGLLVVLWIYPRGKAIEDELSADIIAGAAGVGAALGADFVKINSPEAVSFSESALLLQQAVGAAGRTKVICSGGSKISTQEYIQKLYEQIKTGGAFGCAVGRNVHQNRLDEAYKICSAIGVLLYEDASLEVALKSLN